MTNTAAPRKIGKYEAMYAEPVTPEQAELDALIARSNELDDLFTWDRTEVSNFRWTGTDAEWAEKEAVREAIARHPIIVAENEAMFRAEARMR